MITRFGGKREPTWYPYTKSRRGLVGRIARAFNARDWRRGLGCGLRKLSDERIAFAAMADFADYYREIYARGLGGETPSIPVAVDELERRAREAMDERAANYVFAGAGSEDTMRANRDAFDRRRIVPRMLRDVAERDLSTTVLGTAMPAPLMLAPIGVQKVVHEDGELATARAAAALGLPMIASTASHFTLEEIAAAGGEAPRWFQLYWPNDRRAASRASSAAPRRPATGRSWSPSTPSSPAGSRATCSRPGCPSCRGWATPTTSRTRSSAPTSSRRRRRTRARRPATTSASTPTPRSPGRTSTGCAS